MSHDPDDPDWNKRNRMKGAGALGVPRRFTRRLGPMGWDIYEEDGRDEDLIRHDPPWRPERYPYCYDPFTIWGHPYPDKESNGVDYTDRLEQWDYKKYHRAFNEAKGGEKFNAFNRYSCRGDVIEKMLRIYHANDTIQLRRVVEYCNISNGYPVWCLFYKYDGKKGT